MLGAGPGGGPGARGGDRTFGRGAETVPGRAAAAGETGRPGASGAGPLWGRRGAGVRAPSAAGAGSPEQPPLVSAALLRDACGSKCCRKGVTPQHG